MSTLDAVRVKEPLTEFVNSKLDELEVFASIPSTNTHLLTQAAPRPGHCKVALADHQTSGRGRHEANG